MLGTPRPLLPVPLRRPPSAGGRHVDGHRARPTQPRSPAGRRGRRRSPIAPKKPIVKPNASTAISVSAAAASRGRRNPSADHGPRDRAKDNDRLPKYEQTTSNGPRYRLEDEDDGAEDPEEDVVNSMVLVKDHLPGSPRRTSWCISCEMIATIDDCWPGLSRHAHPNSSASTGRSACMERRHAGQRPPGPTPRSSSGSSRSTMSCGPSRRPSRPHCPEPQGRQPPVR